MWAWKFVTLDHEQVLARRETLDRYGIYAQLSVLIPVFAFQLFRLGRWVYSERQRTKVSYSQVPTSPTLKRQRESCRGTIFKAWHKVEWWLEGEVKPQWGTRGHWLGAGVWGSWLLFLSIHETGDDYLHLTKRVGTVAISQFPAHYALSMKSILSPFATLFSASHEELNPYHRFLGRIIHTLLLLHGVLYINFFYQNGILWQKLGAPVIIIGIVALSMLTVLATTSFASIRRWSYRVFFVLHLTIGVTILPLLFFHSKHLRIYVVEALVLFLLDIVGRKLDTVTGYSKISTVPHTKLIKLVVPIPLSKIARFRDAPGQHVYLSLPPQSVSREKASPLYDLLFNPFTVADVSSENITLVLRVLHGPTTQALGQLAKLRKANPPLNVEGPYGAARKFPSIAKEFDRVLLVAGGVGSTFILPIYQHLRDSREHEVPQVELVWSMRSAAEAAWVKESDLNITEEDKNVSVYVTRASSDDSSSYDQPIPQDGSVELDEMRRDEQITANGGRGRPNLRMIVDSVFKHGNEERVAVMVCGPTEMAVELREHVGRWVSKGRSVWFHDESFGW